MTVRKKAKRPIEKRKRATASKTAGKPKAKPVPAKGTQREPDETAIVLVSLSQSADIFGKDRATIARRIREANLQPAGERRKSPIYRARDVYRLLHDTEGAGEAGELDPSKISDPFRRKAAVQAALEALELGRQRGELIPFEEVEREAARAAKIYAKYLGRVADVLERNGVPVLAREAVSADMDKLREELVEEIGAEDESEPEQKMELHEEQQ